jgi:8-oxo-dGTP pyrophosphatase MutT (NUDIX family)
MTTKENDKPSDQRPSSRLLIVNQDDRVLLFKFDFRRGALAGRTFWATPGGGLEPGETYEPAACREMLEETGLRIDDPGPQIAQRTWVGKVSDGRTVSADERFFLIRLDQFHCRHGT